MGKDEIAHFENILRILHCTALTIELRGEDLEPIARMAQARPGADPELGASIRAVGFVTGVRRGRGRRGDLGQVFSREWYIGAPPPEALIPVEWE